MLTKTKIIRKKSDFFLIKKTSGRMAQAEQQPKFEANLRFRFRDNCVADGRRTTDDGRRTNCDFMSSADIVKQS